MVHASHNITVEGNVAFNTSGHCFLTEEGGERDNKFIGNLGMLTRPGMWLVANCLSSLFLERS